MAALAFSTDGRRCRTVVHVALPVHHELDDGRVVSGVREAGVHLAVVVEGCTPRWPALPDFLRILKKTAPGSTFLKKPRSQNR